MSTLFCLRFLNLLPLGLLLGLISLNNASAQTIVGRWKAYEKGAPSSIIEIYQTTAGLYHGRMVELFSADLVGQKCSNCSDDRRNQPYLRMDILRGLKASPDRKSAEGGKILDPSNGKEYHCKIWVEGKQLRMRAYWGMLYGTRTWERVP